jgi:RNA polymerase sigma-70 factor (ECF subfamily)
MLSGADEEFTGWYELEAPGVRDALALALGDDALAEEAAAEAFVKAFARWEQVRAMTSPLGWVYRVALNEARGRFRRRVIERRAAERRSAQLDVPPPAEPDTALWAAVRALPERARIAVALRYVADLPEGDIAELMGVTRGTVAATLSHARKQLADALRGEREEALP